MLHIKLKESRPSISEEEDFDFFIYFYGLYLGPPGAEPSCTQGLSFEHNL